MKSLIAAGRAFYGIGIAGLGIQQFQYRQFRPVIAPSWPSWIQTPALALITGAALVIAGLLIAIGKWGRTTSIFTGTALLLLFILQAVFQLFIIEYDFHLGLWTDALKELALAGGAFVMAASFETGSKTYWTEKLIPAGRVFFSITMIAFGIDHGLYTGFVVALVPAWIPGHLFWTYFAAVALIGSGLGIMFNIKIRLIGLLLGTMLFIWFIILHIPRAIADPNGAQGNEVTSVFEALAFSGIAFVLAGLHSGKSKS